MGETKKVASTGRFGSRYGVGIRKKVLKVESIQVQKKFCPNCGSNNVKRKSAGIFFCNKCSHKFVGGAYLPKTLTGKIISQMVSQKKFAPKELEEISSPKEETTEKTEEPEKENTESKDAEEIKEEKSESEEEVSKDEKSEEEVSKEVEEEVSKEVEKSEEEVSKEVEAVEEEVSKDEESDETKKE